MLRLLTVPIALCALLGAGCASRPATVPMPTRFDAGACPTATDTLLVLLPGALSPIDEFEREGFIDAVRERGLAVDVVRADAHRAYYDAYVRARLRHEVGATDAARAKLREAKSLGSLKAMAAAEEILDRAAKETPASDLRARAAELAEASGARLRLIAAVEPLIFPAFVNVPAGDTYAEIIRARREMMERAVEEAVAALPPGVQAATRVVEGEPVEAIREAVEDGVDLLAVGSRGWGPVRRVLLGSASARLLRVAPCPVLVTPRGLEEEAAAADAERVSAEVER